MSQLGIDLRAYFLADTSIAAAVGSRIHQNAVPERYDGAYIFLGRAGTDDEDEAFDDAKGTSPFREYWDLEAISDDLDAAESLIALVKRHHRFRGTVGSGSLQALWIRDHADDYLPRGIFDDEGLHAATVQLEIVGYSPGD